MLYLGKGFLVCSFGPIMRDRLIIDDEEHPYGGWVYPCIAIMRALIDCASAIFESIGSIPGFFDDSVSRVTLASCTQ